MTDALERSGGEVALESLMSTYQRGSVEAFEAFYAALAGELLRYLKGLTRDHHRAEDLLQEVFLQIHRARHTYLPGRPVKPWVYAIARNVFLMSRRSWRRRNAHERLAQEELPDMPVPPEVAQLDGKRDLKRLLEELPEMAREVLWLHHVAGLSFQEVGQVLGISAGAAKVRAHRALQQLRRSAFGEGA
ncbi:MAG: RNA polymerase sigma factor [Thermoanaerobaculaceae bacterium]